MPSFDIENFDTREYEWNDISLYIGNVDITGFVNIKYLRKQEKEVRYAKGNTGYSVQFGNISIEGSFTVYQSVKEALNAAGIIDLLSIRNIMAIVQYGNPSTGMPMMTKTIRGISFTSIPDEWSQGDKFQKSELPFLALSVTTK